MDLNNMDPNTLKRAKELIDGMFSWEQKQQLMQKIGNLSPEELQKKLQGISDREAEQMLRKLDKETLLKKWNELR